MSDKTILQELRQPGYASDMTRRLADELEVVLRDKDEELEWGRTVRVKRGEEIDELEEEVQSLLAENENLKKEFEGQGYIQARQARQLMQKSDEMDRLKAYYEHTLKRLDEYEGTPCEQLRHKKEVERLQAQIDSLMLEFCPDEMTPEQERQWGESQRPAFTDPDEYIHINSYEAMLDRNKRIYRNIIDKQAEEIERLGEALRLMLEIAPRGVLNAKEEVALKAAYAALNSEGWR